MFTRVKTARELGDMRTSGRILATILELLKQSTAPGVSPRELAKLAARELKALGGESAFRGYQGYPDVVCISVNSQVQHTIPRSELLKTGDIVNYDFGVSYRGMITDAGLSVGVGKIGKDAQRLLTGCEQALDSGLAVIRDGTKVGDISAAIETVLRAHRLGIVRELVGHGVGDHVHEEPNIPNYGLAGRGPLLRTGMTVAIEPIATLGGERIMTDPDGWTLWTADGSWSAQFEHTIAVTDDGVEILTRL